MLTQGPAAAKSAICGPHSHLRQYPGEVWREGLVNISRRVSLRVSLRWQDTKTDANGRKSTKQDEDAKLQPAQDLHENSPSSLAFLKNG